MDSYTKALILVPIIVIIGLGGLYFFLQNNSSSPATKKRFSQDATKNQQEQKQPSEPNAPLDESKINIGTKEITLGSKFIKLEDGKIYYTESGENKSATHSSEEMLLTCTSQNLTNPSEFDFNLVDKHSTIQADQINEKISAGTAVVVLSNVDENGVYIAHTIAVNDINLCN